MKKKLLVYSCERLIIISFTSPPYDSDNLITDKLTSPMILFPMVLLLSRKIVWHYSYKRFKERLSSSVNIESSNARLLWFIQHTVIHKTNSFERADKVIKLNNWRWKVKYPAVFSIQCSKTGWERRQTSSWKIRTTFFWFTKIWRNNLKSMWPFYLPIRLVKMIGILLNVVHRQVHKNIWRAS